MTTEQKDRVRELVLEAGALDAAARDAFLALEADDEAVLAAAKRRLKRAEEVPDDFLSSPAFVADTPRDSDTFSLSTDSASFLAWDRYEVGRTLGTGGMGTVFKAHDRVLKRPVALKFLLQINDPKTARRFLREAKAQARVKHENVLTVHDTGEIEGMPYIALQYVDAVPLKDCHGTTSLEEKVRLLVGVAEGLHAAHLEGLVHRDVKPSNVLVERQEDGSLKPYVMDFGLALEVQPSDDTTASVTVAGSPAYMAPEQILEGNDAIDRRTDVYGLGVTMYELLTGAVPFPGLSSLEVLDRIVHDEAPPPREHQPSLPAELEAIVLKCLHKQPEQRYASAREVALDLRRFLDHEPVEAHASNVAYRAVKWMARHRALASTAVVSLVLLLTLVVAFAVQTATQSRAVAREAERANREAVNAQQISAFLVALFRVSGNQEGNTVTARELLDRGAERVEKDLYNQPLVQASLMEAIGNAYDELGLPEPADYMFAKSLALYREHLGQDAPETVRLREQLTDLRRRHGR